MRPGRWRGGAAAGGGAGRHARRGLLLVALVAVMVGFQERPRRYWGGGGWRPEPYREGLPTTPNGGTDRGFTFCRLLYQSVRREPLGHGWNTDYPGSDWNFMERLEELTTVRIAQWTDGQPGFAVVRPSQDELFECPFLFASDVGSAGFSEAEVERLRSYLLKGGLLWVDDFWGEWAWHNWATEIGRVLPGLPIVDVPSNHRLLEMLYDVPRVPQVPSIQFWRRTGRRETSEQGPDSRTPHLRAIFDERGRPLVVMTHNTDIADGWEREGEDDEFFYAFSPDAYALGINIVLYALTH